MIQALGPELTGALSTGQFPLVYGADCSVLLAALPTLRDTAGEPGLLFIDGHEDATLMEQSPDGEAANMEIAILLGMTGHRLPQPLRTAVGVLKSEALVMLGPHDDPFRSPLGVGTVAGRVALLNSDEVSADPTRTATEAVQRITVHAPNWWLHTDLDVLAEREFSAHGAPGEVALSGGLTWRALTEVVVAALETGGCRGWSLVIYNPDLDPGGSQAHRIVQFVSEVASHLP